MRKTYATGIISDCFNDSFRSYNNKLAGKHKRTWVPCNEKEEKEEMKATITVDGNEYMKNSRGDLVPATKIKDVDLLRDDVVRAIVEKAEGISNGLKCFKDYAMEEAKLFCEISLERHGVKYGGKKGNVSLTTYNGEYRVSIDVQDILEFDEQLQAAKELVDRCIRKWSDGAEDNLRILVNDAFRVDKKGNVDTKRILELRRYEIDDPDWRRAMEAISDSIKVNFSRRYMRIHRRDKEGKYQQIPLDFSAV